MDKNRKVEISVKDLTVSFRTTQGMVRAVRGVSFDLYKGETLAIVGESGSGKSVSSRAIIGILAGNAVIDKGHIIYEDQDLTKIPEEEFHKIRGNKIGMIFQDPLSSLNPIMRIGKQITEGMIINGKRIKNRYKALIHDEKMKIINAKLEIIELQRQYEMNEDPETQMSKETFQKKVSEIKAKMPEFKKALKAKSVIAKKQVKAEYKAEKENTQKRINELLPKVKSAQESANNSKLGIQKAVSETKAAYQKKLLDLKTKFGGETSKIKRAEFTAEQKVLKADYKEKLNEARAPYTQAKANLKAAKQAVEHEKEMLRRYVKVTKKEAHERAIQIMTEVGIPEPKKRFKMYPFQFSGGMRQRIVIAIALTADPEVLICDEPTTALDVTIQAQILDLIKKLKEERGLSVIFITHDLGVVANVSDRVAVMYAGKIVEYGTSDEIFYNPRHPYTWALLSSMPDLNSSDRLTAIQGTPPNMLFPPAGDAFAERNPYAMEIDFKQEPPVFKINDDHYAATWLLHPDAPKVDIPELIQTRIKRMEEKSKEMMKHVKQ